MAALKNGSCYTAEKTLGTVTSDTQNPFSPLEAGVDMASDGLTAWDATANATCAPLAPA